MPANSSAAPFVSKAFHGKESRIQVGPAPTSFVKASNANCSQKAEFGDLTNFESGGADEGIKGVGTCTWGLKGVWREDFNPWADPPGFYVRDDLQELIFWGNWNVRQQSFAFRFLWAIVNSAEMTMDAKDIVKISSDGKNNGYFLAGAQSIGVPNQDRLAAEAPAQAPTI